MGWTYNGDPGASDRDAVRYLIGDTDPTDEQLQDQEIAYHLAEEPSVLDAAIAACQGLASKYARKVSRTVGDISVSHEQLQEHYERRAAQLREELGDRDELDTASLGATGLLVSSNDDPLFSTHMHEDDRDHDY